MHQGKFKKLSEFDMFDNDLRRRYRGKVFLFEKCVVYTEIVDSATLRYRGHFSHLTTGFTFEEVKNNFKLFVSKRGNQEVEFQSDNNTIQLWIEMLTQILLTTAISGNYNG